MIEFVLAILLEEWIIVFIAFFGAILISFFPWTVRRKGFAFSSVLNITLLVFIFLTFYLGWIKDYYARFWWWDIMLHTITGFALSIIGISMIYLINEKSKTLNLSPFFIVFFGFCFSMTLGVFWEFFEFFMDQFVGTTMQSSGLHRVPIVDTMIDLMVNALGAFVISYFAFLGLKRNPKGTLRKFSNLIKKIK
jgi:hypothetical protein